MQLVARPDARAALEAWVREFGTLREAAASGPGAEALEGRGRVHVVAAPVGEGQWVVRPYRRGGVVASWLGDRYLRMGTPRPVREFHTGRLVEQLGVPTVRHVGGAVYPAGLWYRGDLVTELVPDARDLAAVLFGAADGGGGDEGDGNKGSGAEGTTRERAMEAAGSLVRLLHERGVVHRDLNLKNILIAEGGRRALVLDLDRASVEARVGERARRRMLNRFWRSARKWEAARGRPLDRRLRSAFDAGYGHRTGA